MEQSLANVAANTESELFDRHAETQRYRLQLKPAGWSASWAPRKCTFLFVIHG